MKYLRGTIDFKLHLTNNTNELIGYSDASWGESKEDGKSQSGYLFTLYGNLISWNSTKQKSTAISSTESQLCALSKAAMEALWIFELLNEIHLKPKIPVIIHQKYQRNKNA